MTDWHGPKWEYHVKEIEMEVGPMSEGALDEAGAWGWELVAVTQTFASPVGHQLVYTFKRPLSHAKIELP